MVSVQMGYKRYILHTQSMVGTSFTDRDEFICPEKNNSSTELNFFFTGSNF